MMKATVALASALVVGGATLATGTALPRETDLPVPETRGDARIERRAADPAAPEPPIRPFPTNAWWSGGSLEAFPSPLFAWPLKIDLGSHGAVVDVPGTHVAERAAFAVERAPLRVTWHSAPDRARVASFGAFDVTFDLFAGRTRLGRVTAVQGSPFVWFERGRSLPDARASEGAVTEELPCSRPCVDARLVTYRDASYLIARSRTVLAIAAIAPESDPGTYLAYAFDVPKKTSVSWKIVGKSVETTFSFPRRTIVGLLPHHQDERSSRRESLVGRYDTLRGPITAIEAREFTIRTPVPDITPDAPLHASLRRDRSFLDTLTDEIDGQPPAAGDTYAAGKSLLRSALLAHLADGADDDALKERALAKASGGLASWCRGETGRYVYDDRLGGIIGEPTSFGSERFNDHHFHYGYVIHAAAIVARLDPDWEGAYGDCIDALIRDIAADEGDLSFPANRYMDAYAGHSWANGITRFADGQNQESTSEAVHAWYAVALWGDVTGDRALSERGRWLASLEATGAKAYWFNASRTKTLPAGFAHPMASIVWGGKVDYATFFDPSDGAIRGIQFFPATMALEPLLNRDIVDRIIRPVLAGDGLWQNHLRLVAAMAGARTGPPEGELDAFYSRSYVRNWLATF